MVDEDVSVVEGWIEKSVFSRTIHGIDYSHVFRGASHSILPRYDEVTDVICREREIYWMNSLGTN